MEYKEVQASSIPPGKDLDNVTYQDVQSVINNFVGNVNYDMLEQQLFSNGQSKSPPSKLKLTQLIQCLNMLMYDFIKTHNQSENTNQNNILNGYFEGVNRMAKILDSTDIKVAETKMLCYIMGYLLKLINHFKHSEEQNNTTR